MDEQPKVETIPTLKGTVWISKLKHIYFPSPSEKVDGDTDSPTVQREFERIVRDNIQKVLKQQESAGNRATEAITPVRIGNFKSAIQRSRKSAAKSSSQQDAIVHDLDADVPGVVPTISHHVSLANGHLGGGGAVPVAARNGHVPNGKLNFRNMLDEADHYDSHM